LQAVDSVAESGIPLKYPADIISSDNISLPYIDCDVLFATSNLGLYSILLKFVDLIVICDNLSENKIGVLSNFGELAIICDLYKLLPSRIDEYNARQNVPLCS